MSRCRSLVAAVLVVAAPWAVATPAAHAASKHSVFGARILTVGAKGRDVRVLQDFLSRAGVGTPVDGHFGPYTRGKVREWERRRASAADASGTDTPDGLRVDGRLNRREAKLLRRDVEQAEAGRAPVGGQPAAPAPAPPGPRERATLAADGTAVAPASAPELVKRIIAAGNEIHDKPYRYGGGHGKWKDSGYDCSGSMSYAFHGAGMLEQALDSSGFARWGRAGAGRWVTIYANSGHSYMVVAGLRFDTSGRADAGSRWQGDQRSSSGYTVRHPAGL